VLWLRIVTWAPAITAPLGSVTVPKTLATSVCGRARAGSKANGRTKSKHAIEPRNAQTWARPQSVQPAAKGVGSVGFLMTHSPALATRRKLLGYGLLRYPRRGREYSALGGMSIVVSRAVGAPLTLRTTSSFLVRLIARITSKSAPNGTRVTVSEEHDGLWSDM
jgi:hypothetical protein